MVDIKTNISFDEYTAIVNKVVNDCFPNGVYTPANYQLSFMTALVVAFAPDYDLSDCKDNNSLWCKILSEETDAIIKQIQTKSEKIVSFIRNAVWKGIEFKIKMATSSPMSVSDMALSRLFESLTNKVEKIDTSVMTQKNIDRLADAVSTMQSGEFINFISDSIVKKNTEINRDKNE